MQGNLIPFSFNNKNTPRGMLIFPKQSLFLLFALAASFINMNYAASIIFGSILLVFGFFSIIVNPKSLLTQRLFYINLVFAFVSMDLPPFSEGDWSAGGSGSGFINTPLTKVFLLYLIIWVLAKKSSFNSLSLCSLAALLIVIFESLNYYSLGAVSSTWYAILILLVLGLSIHAANYCNPDDTFFDILKYSVIAIGARSLLFIIGNVAGINDYLTYGQKPIIGWVFIIYCFIANYKMKFYLLALIFLTVIPVGKVEYFYFLLLFVIKPYFFLISLLGLAILLIFGGNIHLLLKLSEILSIFGLDSFVNSIGVLFITADAGSIGVRVGEFLAIMNGFFEKPYSIVMGLNGHGLSLDSVRYISGELSRFDYTESEFSKNIIINTHGFYNRLLYSTGLIGFLLYLGMVSKSVYSLSSINSIANLTVIKKYLFFAILMIMFLLESFYKPEIFIVLLMIASRHRM